MINVRVLGSAMKNFQRCCFHVRNFVLMLMDVGYCSLMNWQRCMSKTTRIEREEKKN